MERFYSTTLKCEVQQINKTKARRLYDEGQTIYFKSSNMMFDSMWQSPCPIEKSRANYGETFETICNDFTYYNCDNERGKYIHFFVKC